MHTGVSADAGNSFPLRSPVGGGFAKFSEVFDRAGGRSGAESDTDDEPAGLSSQLLSPDALHSRANRAELTDVSASDAGAHAAAGGGSFVEDLHQSAGGDHVRDSPDADVEEPKGVVPDELC